MRVYTARGGRMWRTPNIVRTNGKYKVPITVEKALKMTPKLLDDVCSSTRAEPKREVTSQSMPLSALFTKCQAKITEAVKKQAKAVKENVVLSRVKGAFPLSIERIMADEDIALGAGFQKLSMQLAIPANAMG